MRIPDDILSNKLLASIILEYCNNELFPLITHNKIRIRCKLSTNNSFNATVSTIDCRDYDILINEGIINTFIKTINSLNDENIDEEISLISNVLLNDVNKKDDIYRTLVYGATFFIIFHEFAHIFRGHFHYAIENEICNQNKTSSYNFDEITDEPTFKTDIFNNCFLKLIELDADNSSLNIFFQISLELFALTSEYFEKEHIDWRTKENPQWRYSANKIAYYATSLALAMIEANRNKNVSYPMPLSRFLNISETYKQEIYNSFNIVSRVNRGEIQTFSLSDEQKEIKEKYIFMPFLFAIDIILESAKLKEVNILDRFGSEEIELYEKLYFDYLNLCKSLTFKNLISKEGKEFQYLRNMYPNFQSIFKAFIIFD